VDFGVFPSLNQVSVFSVSVSVRFDSFSSPAGFSGIWAWGNYYSGDFANDLFLYTVASGVVNIQVNNAADGGAVGPTLLVNGQFGDTRIYNRALSPNEIRLLAQRPGIAYELAPRKTYFIQAATSTSQFYDVLSPLIFAGTN
jgi:hypothetical protein